MYQMSHNSNYLPRSALPHFPFTRRERERERVLRASVAAVAKIMSFYHTKSLLYYFTTSFYNISFIRCYIFLPLHLK